MATRFYYESVGTVPISPAFDGAWGDTEDAQRFWLASQTGLSTLTNNGMTGDEAVTTNPLDVLAGQFIGPPLSAQTISGTVKGQIRCRESSATADFRAQVVIRVVSNDGTSVVGTLLAADASALSSEFPVDGTGLFFTNRKFPLAASSPATLSSLAVSAGDRLCVEVGFRSHNSSASNFGGAFVIGSNSGTDLPEDETDTSNSNPWIEFSNTVTFQDVPLKVTQTMVEAVIYDATPSVKATQVMIEAVVERDYVWLD